jgi:hypothetical protein
MKYRDLSIGEMQLELFKHAANTARHAASMKDPKVREIMWSLAKLYRQLAEDAGNLAELRASTALQNQHADISQS